jgi:hypothetical protein
MRSEKAVSRSDFMHFSVYIFVLIGVILYTGVVKISFISMHLVR